MTYPGGSFCTPHLLALFSWRLHFCLLYSLSAFNCSSVLTIATYLLHLRYSSRFNIETSNSCLSEEPGTWWRLPISLVRNWSCVLSSIDICGNTSRWTICAPWLIHEFQTEWKDALFCLELLRGAKLSLSSGTKFPVSIDGLSDVITWEHLWSLEIQCFALLIWTLTQHLNCNENSMKNKKMRKLTEVHVNVELSFSKFNAYVLRVHSL